MIARTRMSPGTLLLGLAVTLVTAVGAPLAADEKIRLIDDFSVSPDGETIIFNWAGDLWTAPSDGGAVTPITRHAANDRRARYSPDGSEIAFISNRAGGAYQIYTMPASGGVPVQRSFHSDGYSLHEYYPTGDAFLASGSRDHFYRSSSRHLRVVRDDPAAAEEVLFDAAGEAGTISPDGKRVLFMREGAPTYRKGYRGSQAGQIWMLDLAKGEYREILHDDFGYRWPLWKPDGSGFYYVGQQSGSFNLWSYDLASGDAKQLTYFRDDSVLWPSISRDGSTIVFRHLFDLYRMDPRTEEAPVRIELVNAGEPVIAVVERSVLTSATDAAFTTDGLEVAFVSGGDVWVMDTELREPRQVTATPEEEREPLFSPDGETLYFVSDTAGRTDIWTARRKNTGSYWWQNSTFQLDRVTDDAAVESEITFSPTGDTLAFVRGRGDLMLMDPDGKNARRFLPGWNQPDFEFSPDGRWIAYAVDDDDFNQDVWIAATDGSGEPFNVSTHPDNDGSPSWSPDGKILAFTGRRASTETDIYYVYLRAEDAEEDSRDRTLEKAIEKMEKERKSGKKGGRKGGDKTPAKDAPDDKEVATDGEKSGDDTSAKPDAKPETKPEVAKLPEVKIDFAGLRDRIRRISNPDSDERGLVWIADEKLAFSARIDGDSAIYTVEFPDELRPKKLTSTSLRGARYLAKSKSIVGLAGGNPASMTPAGKLTSYGFRCLHETDREAHYRAGFQMAWRAMRDGFYDENLGNRNWDAIRRKYEDAAAGALDPGAFEQVVELMLGELNGSHLGFSTRWRGYRADVAWTESTAHLGLRYDPAYKGPGWRVRDVIEGGPASEQDTAIAAGEIILSIDGTEVDPSINVARVLNGPSERDIALRVRALDGEERDVTIRPTSYGRIRGLLYQHWLEQNRTRVDAASGQTLGYLHIRGMNWGSFLTFEEELHRVGHGKDGLIIDVRGNGGGSTADHLLTVLSQPTHAVTVPRGVALAIPQDRRVYATWNKPIVVLCDQDSFSNAEIFAHAIKTLGRGQLVGVTTAGGVISTGGTGIMDLGFLRMPFRGWFVASTGEDMELNGAVPQHIVWPEPGTLPAGTDRQLTTAVDVLLEEVAEWKARPRPELRKASEREMEGTVSPTSAKF